MPNSRVVPPKSKVIPLSDEVKADIDFLNGLYKNEKHLLKLKFKKGVKKEARKTIKKVFKEHQAEFEKIVLEKMLEFIATGQTTI